MDATSCILNCDIFKTSTKKISKVLPIRYLEFILELILTQGGVMWGNKSRFSEEPYLQHRKHKIGRFKSGAKNVNWSNLKKNIPEADLNILGIILHRTL